MKNVNVLPVTVEGEILAKLRHRFGHKAQIQEGDIRLETVLNSASVKKRFNMNGDGQSTRPLESFIGRNDLVVTYALKVAINKVDTTGNATNGNSIDYTYPDLGVFTDPAVAPNVSEASALESVFGGNMTIKANTTEILNQMQLRRFRIAPETQLSATTQASLMEDGFVPFVQPYIFSGRDTNILEFEPAVGADTALIGGATGTQNVLVFHFKSFVVRNGAQPLTVEEADRVAQVMKNYTSSGALL